MQSATRDRILRSVLQPSSLDLVNPAASTRLGLEGYCVLLQVGGSEAVMQRYTSELAEATVHDDSLWTRVSEFTPDWLRDNPQGAVTRLSTTLKGVSDAMAGAPGRR